MNHLKTYILLAAMTALFGGVGYLVGGTSGMLIALAVAGAMNLFAYWNADKMVLKHFRAQPIDPRHPDPRVRAYAEDTLALAQAAGLPILSTILSPTLSPPAAIRITRRSRPQPALLACFRAMRFAA